MNPSATRFLCRLLILALFALPLRPAFAGMIGTDQALSAAAVQADRAAVATALGRADVARELQAQGVDPEVVKLRVAALSDEEVHRLAGQIATAPAGGDVSGWAVAAVLAAALVIWWFFAYR